MPFLSASQLRDLAKRRLTGHYSACVRLVIFVILLQLIVRNLYTNIDDLLYDMFAKSAIVPQIAVIAQTLISFMVLLILNTIICMLSAGIALYFTKQAIGQHSLLSDLFYGFREDPGKAIRVSAFYVFPTVLPLLPTSLVLALYSETRSAIYLYIGGICFLIGLVVRIYFALGLDFVFYFMIDFPELSPLEIAQHSWRRMKGHRLRYLSLLLSYIPLYILSIFSLFLGYLWVYPFIQQTKALFYLDLMKPSQTYRA